MAEEEYSVFINYLSRDAENLLKSVPKASNVNVAAVFALTSLVGSGAIAKLARYRAPVINRITFNEFKEARTVYKYKARAPNEFEKDTYTKNVERRNEELQEKLSEVESHNHMLREQGRSDVKIKLPETRQLKLREPESNFKATTQVPAQVPSQLYRIIFNHSLNQKKQKSAALLNARETQYLLPEIKKNNEELDRVINRGKKENKE